MQVQRAQPSYPLPDRLAGFAGRIVDVDGHEAIPINLWESEFGAITNELRDVILRTVGAGDVRGDLVFFEQLTEDKTPINVDTVFKVKLERAPGGISLDRRLEVMDFMGIDRQLIYPGGMPLSACTLASASDTGMFAGVSDRKGYAARLIAAYNDWVIRNSRKHNRYRFVGVLLHDTVEGLLAETRHMLDNNVRAFWTPQARLIGGHSPAHTALDPFWSLLAATSAPFVSHISDETEFLKTMQWRKAPAFEGWKIGAEMSMDPWTLNSLHLSTQNVVMSMVMGGVFERHPRLRYGAAEVSAHWLGPLATSMDLWHRNNRKFMQAGGESPLRKLPSEYLASNVRVSPFDIEDVGSYIERYGLEDCYCFAADFPHHEGGRRPIEDFTNSLSHLNDAVVRKFFIDNGKWILPD